MKISMNNAEHVISWHKPSSIMASDLLSRISFHWATLSHQTHSIKLETNQRHLNCWFSWIRSLLHRNLLSFQYLFIWSKKKESALYLSNAWYSSTSKALIRHFGKATLQQSRTHLFDFTYFSGWLCDFSP